MQTNKSKGKKSASKAKKEKAPPKKKSPAAEMKKSPVVEKKKVTTTPAAKAGSSISNFFGRKDEKSDSKDNSEYNPLAAKYHPIDNASWEKNKP